MSEVLERGATVREAADARSLRDIVRDLAHDAQELFRGEMALARSELAEKMQTAVMALVWTFGGMFVGFAGLIVLLLAGVAALEFVIPTWAACLVVGFVIAAIGAGLTLLGIRRLKLSSITPEHTARSVGQDARLVKEHL